MYDTTQLRRLHGRPNFTTPGDSKLIIYARVSTSKQRDDLQPQLDELTQAYPGYIVISGVASGMNFKRPGLCSFLEAVHGGKCQGRCGHAQDHMDVGIT